MWLKNVSKVAPIKEAFKCFLSFIFAAVEPGRSSSSSRFFASTVFRNSSVHGERLKGNSAVITAFKLNEAREKLATGLWELAPGEVIPDYSAFKS